MISSTYAWFSSAATLRLSDIEIGLEKESPLRVGVRKAGVEGEVTRLDQVTWSADGNINDAWMRDATAGSDYSFVQDTPFVPMSSQCDELKARLDGEGNPVLDGDGNVIYEQGWLSDKYDDSAYPRYVSVEGLKMANRQTVEGIEGKRVIGQYQMELYFYSEVSCYILLDVSNIGEGSDYIPKSTVLPNKEENLAWALDHTDTSEEGVAMAENLNNAAKAIRMSFYTYDEVETGVGAEGNREYERKSRYLIYDPYKEDGKEVSQAARLNIERDDYWDTDRMDDTREYVYGFTEDGERADDVIKSMMLEHPEIYDEPREDEDDPLPDDKKNNFLEGITQAGVKAFNIDKAKAVTDEEGKKLFVPRVEKSISYSDFATTDDYASVIVKDQKRYIAKLRGGIPKRVVTTVYCEGWDNWTIDRIGNANFQISMNFAAYLSNVE